MMYKMRKIFALFIVLSIVLSSFTSVLAVDVEDVSNRLKGALLGDLETGEILYKYNIDKPLAIASISKLMTYCILMDKVSLGEISLEDEVTISREAAYTEGSHFGMEVGEKIKLSVLVDALLVISGNDVAVAIAEYVGKTQENFVQMMNDKCKELGLKSARFINPNGLPVEDKNGEYDQNYMSVNDLFTFSRHLLLTYPQILDVTSKKELVLPERKFERKSTNPLFNVVDGVDGLKTGYTDEAGICLISTLPVKANDSDTKNYRIIAIVMGAMTHPERIEKSKALLEHGRQDYIMKNICSKDDFDIVNIKNAKIIETKAYPVEDYSKIICNNSNVKKEFVYNEELKAPLKANEKIGKINIYIDDELVKSIDIEVREEIKKANIFVRIFRFFKNLF